MPPLSAKQAILLLAGGMLLGALFLFGLNPVEELVSPGMRFFAPTAFLGAILVFILAREMFSRTAAWVVYLMAFVFVSLAVFASHAAQAYLFGTPEVFGAILLRRLAIANLILIVLLRQAALARRLKQRETAELHAQVQALQSRIRPHFLFNSMNVIASLIPVDAEKAEQVVEDLSELFRASLQEAGTFVSVSQELELCRRYLNIEMLRLGERLKLRWNVEAPPQGAEMPLLLIQPLLENAVYHGIQPLAAGGVIDVNLAFEADEMVLQISNPLQTMTATPSAEGEAGQTAPKPPAKGNSIALDNIRRRLAVVYGENAKLITKKRGSVFETTLRCPTVPKLL